MLTALHRANIFVIPLDDEGLWFRYHHLFADLLQARLRHILLPDAITDLHNALQPGMNRMDLSSKL